MMGYKLRIYHTNGVNKGMLNKVEFFPTIEEMQKRYNELFVYENYGYNPTAWERIDGEWKRLEGY